MSSTTSCNSFVPWLKMMSFLAFHIVQMMACHTIQKPLCNFFLRTDPNQQSRCINRFGGVTKWIPSQAMTIHQTLKAIPQCKKKMRCCFHHSFAPHTICRNKMIQNIANYKVISCLNPVPQKLPWKRHDSRWRQTLQKAPKHPFHHHYTQHKIFLKLEFLSMHVD